MELKQKLIAATIFLAAATSALAETEKALPALNAFNNAELPTLFEEGAQHLQVLALSAQEMRETEGAIAPLVYLGAMVGGGFIIQRAVTQKVAQNMVKSGARNILAPNRAVARNIAGRNPIREYHAGSGNRYTHYHPNPRNGSHIWYGNPR